MAEGRTELLFEELSKVDNPVERSQISYFILGRIAAGMENDDEGADLIKTSMGEIWLQAADRFERILKEDPEAAFNMAIHLTMLPVSPDKDVEKVNKWLRGDGPGMLGRDELRVRFLTHLSNEEKSEPLVFKLSEYLSYDFSKIRDSKTAFEDPNCYLSLSTILLGMKIGTEKDLNGYAEGIAEKSKLRLVDPDVGRVIDYYQNLEDTKWLADELKSFNVK